MIDWYSNKKVGIAFNDIPSVGIRYVIPTSTSQERKSIEKFPFINKTNLDVNLLDKKKGKFYNFTVPKGYCFDGASVPRFFWRVIGSNTDNKFLIAALIHDTLCENHQYVENDRKFSSLVFNALLEVAGVGPFKRFFMKTSVDIYQKFFSKWR